MLQITIPSNELWDAENQMFIQTKDCTLNLEHSLVSVSKWESKWNKSFFSKKEKTYEEILDYVRCMTLTQNVNPYVYIGITKNNLDAVYKYINAPMTATVFSETKRGGNNRETITSELIYYWMITFNIPFECQKWHLNRLITLIRVCGIKNSPHKKRSKREIMSQNAALNAARRKKFNTKG